jgi:hypothetical protein
VVGFFGADRLGAEVKSFEPRPKVSLINGLAGA